jgi:hypothetical protein
VGVNKDVRLVHNSLSIHPEEEATLAGANVSNVAFGNPIVTSAIPLTPFSLTIPAGTTSGCNEPQPQSFEHVNDKLLDHVQLVDTTIAPIFMQWEGVTKNHGLLIINNLVLLDIGANTGQITLSDIRFPGLAQVVQADMSQAGSVASQSVAGSAGQSTAGETIINRATNSGIVWHNQFSDGGFGDIGMQWRNVHVHGQVTVVHNTLSIDVASKNTGPINVSNVAFNSGALNGSALGPNVKEIIAPPPYFSRIPGVRADRSKPLPHDPNIIDHSTNSGILIGGQFSARGLGHIFLQWRNVKIHGPVTVMDNVLSINTCANGSGPITVSHVTYA